MNHHSVLATVAALGLLLLACAEEGVPVALPAAEEPAASTEQAVEAFDVYVVQRGDYLVRIGEQLGVPLATLLALNQVPDPARIEVGQRLRLPKGTLPQVAQSAPPAATPASIVPDLADEQRRIVIPVPDVSVPEDVRAIDFPWQSLTPAQAALIVLSAITALAVAAYLVSSLVSFLRDAVPAGDRRLATAGPTEWPSAPVAPSAAARNGPATRERLDDAPPKPTRRRSDAWRNAGARAIRRLANAVQRANRAIGSAAVRGRGQLGRWASELRAARAREAAAAEEIGKARGGLSLHFDLPRPTGGRRAEVRELLAKREETQLIRIGLVDEAERRLQRLLIECQQEGWEPEAALCLLALADVETARSNEEEAQYMRAHAEELLSGVSGKELEAARAVRSDWAPS